MPDEKSDDKAHKDLINFAFAEFGKAISEAQQGKAPTKSYDKIKQIYDTLSAAEKKREQKEITDEELQQTLHDQVEKLKKQL